MAEAAPWEIAIRVETAHALSRRGCPMGWALTEHRGLARLNITAKAGGGRRRQIHLPIPWHFDVTHGFIRRYAVTPANIHDSQILTHVLDPENSNDFVWADSGYAGERFEGLLELAGFESCIHEKGARNHPLSEEAR